MQHVLIIIYFILSINKASLVAQWSSTRTPGEINGNPLQYSSLGNPMDRGAWWAIVHRVAKESDMTATKQQIVFMNM